MHRIKLGLADLSATRFAISPIGETVAALGTLADPGRHAPHLAWIRWAQRRLDEHNPDLGLVHILLNSPTGRMPAFLAPPPSTRLPTVEAELDDVRRSPAKQVRGSLDRLFPRRRAGSFVDDLYASPRRWLPRVAEQLRAAHETLIAPHWPRIVATLDADVLHRSRIAAADGMAAMIDGLHERIRWDDTDLLVSPELIKSAEPEIIVIPGKGGLVIMPSVFVWPYVWTRSRTPTFTTLRYPARGIGALWEHPDLGPTPGPALDRLLGKPRARLLQLLRAPTTPTELADRLGVTRGAISQHLAVLREAGLVGCERRGRTALYLLTSLGNDLADQARRP
jgi:DNA-binding transcriptional ArsR family regulator